MFREKEYIQYIQLSMSTWSWDCSSRRIRLWLLQVSCIAL